MLKSCSALWFLENFSFSFVFLVLSSCQELPSSFRFSLPPSGFVCVCVCVCQVFLDPSTADTRTACSSELYDITLVQMDLLRAISEPNYFTQRVHICMENYERNVQQGAG